MTGPQTSLAMRIAALVLGNLIILAALLIVFELVFGNWIRPLGVEDLRRFSIPVDVQYQFEVPYSRQKGQQITYTRDKWGLRGNHKRLSDIDVLTVGGSTTEQRYLDDSETWQAYAERELRKRGLQVEFGNAGVDGQSTIGHLFNFENWFPLLPELRPKVVLFYVGINDVLQPASRADFDAKLDATSWRVRSVTWQLLKTIQGNLVARDTRAAHGLKPKHSESDFTGVGMLSTEHRLYLAKGLTDRFLANIARLSEDATSMGAIPVFVTQTAYAWDSGPAAPRGLNHTITTAGEKMNFADVSYLHHMLNERLLAYCDDTGLTCFDLAADLRLDENDFYDYLHTTPVGAERIGRYIAEQLAERASQLDLRGIGIDAP